ncbi:hypothetical protein BDK51DRAFT_31343, partial [Blyttiomyces helicus]
MLFLAATVLASAVLAYPASAPTLHLRPRLLSGALNNLHVLSPRQTVQTGLTCPTSLPRFECKPAKSEHVYAEAGKDVHHLRPQDISLVAALGDSITAGLFMEDGKLPGSELTLKEYRGKVFDIGGDPGETTIPNLLKTYNPKLE